VALIYLVQSSTELEGTAGYSYGLLSGEHQRLLITFAEYNGKDKQTIFRERAVPVPMAVPPSPKKDKS
jgi:hypothetical protein